MCLMHHKGVRKMTFPRHVSFIALLWFILSIIICNIAYFFCQQHHALFFYQQQAIVSLKTLTTEPIQPLNYKTLTTLTHSLYPKSKLYELSATGQFQIPNIPPSTNIDVIKIKKEQTKPLLHYGYNLLTQQNTSLVVLAAQSSPHKGFWYWVLPLPKMPLFQIILHILVITMTIFFIIFGFLGLQLWRINSAFIRPLRQLGDHLSLQSHTEKVLTITPPIHTKELLPIIEHSHRMSVHIEKLIIQLHQETNKRRELLVQLSHELKTPLSSLLDYLEAWQQQQSTPNTLINTAYRNAQKLSIQLHQHLEMARSQTPELQQPHFSSVNLRCLIDDNILSMNVQAQKKAITLSMSMTENYQVEGDEILLQRLFANLFENAIRHAPIASDIQINVKAQDHQILVQLKNPIDPITQNSTLGLGLGLKIIKSILKIHQSQLHCEQTQHHYCQSFLLPLISSRHRL